MPKMRSFFYEAIGHHVVAPMWDESEMAGELGITTGQLRLELSRGRYCYYVRQGGNFYFSRICRDTNLLRRFGRCGPGEEQPDLFEA